MVIHHCIYVHTSKYLVQVFMLYAKKHDWNAGLRTRLVSVP